VASSTMTLIDRQEELALSRKPEQVSMPVEMIRAKRTASGAFTLACDCSGLEDKEICAGMDPALDAGYFSRMKKGLATLDGDRLNEFCGVVGNTIYAEWMAYQVGCTLMLIKSVAERRAEEAERRAEIAETQNKLMRELLQGRTT
jgi:hypothetical protein